MGQGAQSRSSGPYVRKAVRYAANGEVENCVFCNIVAGTDSQATRTIGATARVAAFLPRHPKARDHILVVPHEHIQHVDALLPDDDAAAKKREGSKAEGTVFGGGTAALLREMRAFGLKCARERDPQLRDDQVQLAFHKPPFNSVDHLHLHVFCLPFSTMWHRIQYLQGTPWSESFDALWLRKCGRPFVSDDKEGGNDRAGSKL